MCPPARLIRGSPAFLQVWWVMNYVVIVLLLGLLGTMGFLGRADKRRVIGQRLVRDHFRD